METAIGGPTILGWVTVDGLFRRGRDMRAGGLA